MQGRHWPWLAVLAAALAIGGATASDGAPTPPRLKFLTPADIAPDHLLPPPPAPGSYQARAEVAELQHLQEVRTPAQFAAAKADEDNETPSAFDGVFGPGFDLKATPATRRMLSDVQHEEKIAAKAAKNYFLRPRPWIVDPDLKTCSREDAPRSSYPSGHSTMAYAVAVALAAAAPDKAPAIFERAQQYAQHRLVCGMHFRSDIAAGEALGTAVSEALLQKPAFEAEVAAAHRELAAAHDTAP